MAVNLEKGQKINLTKDNGEVLNEIMVGLGWDQAASSGGGLRGLFKSSTPSVDCDASIIICGENGKTLPGDVKKSCIYFGNKKNDNGSIIHSGDNLTGAGDGDDEQINIKLSEIPSDVDKLVFVVNIYGAIKRKQHFGMIKNAFIRIVDKSNGSEFCHFNLTDDYNEATGLVVAEIYRNEGTWKFNAAGQGVKQVDGLMDLIKMYQ